MITKIQEVASSVAINEKQNIFDESCRYTRAQGAFSDKVTPDIDYFTEVPLIKCDFPILKKIMHIDELMIQIRNKDANKVYVNTRFLGTVVVS